MTRTRVKICGITNVTDAVVAAQAGADALGFIFVPDTPRYVGNRGVSALLAQVPPFVQTVAVALFPEQAQAQGGQLCNAVQYYEENPRSTLRAQLPGVWEGRRVRAFRVKDEGCFSEIEAALQQHSADAILLDAYHKDKLGGSGETFNWELAAEAVHRFSHPIILAGGLTPENVEDAIARVRPYAVDVSSGVEAEPGRKDHARVRAFLRAVQRADTLL